MTRQSVSRKGKNIYKFIEGYWTVRLRNKTEYKASPVSLSLKQVPQKVGVFVENQEGLISGWSMMLMQRLLYFRLSPRNFIRTSVPVPVPKVKICIYII